MTTKTLHSNQTAQNSVNKAVSKVISISQFSKLKAYSSNVVPLVTPAVCFHTFSITLI